MFIYYFFVKPIAKIIKKKFIQILAFLTGVSALRQQNKARKDLNIAYDECDFFSDIAIDKYSKMVLFLQESRNMLILKELFPDIYENVAARDNFFNIYLKQEAARLQEIVDEKRSYYKQLNADYLLLIDR